MPRRAEFNGVVHLGMFSAGFTRLLRDQAVVDGNLPAQTRYLTVDGVRGWLYPIRSELGDEYELFLYFDGGAYQVKVVSPDVEDGLSPHDCHLFADGRICLGDLASGGMPTLEEAYARSVVWCNGFSVYLQNGKFPF